MVEVRSGGKSETRQILELLEKEKNERSKWDKVSRIIAVLTLIAAWVSLIVALINLFK